MLLNNRFHSQHELKSVDSSGRSLLVVTVVCSIFINDGLYWLLFSFNLSDGWHWFMIISIMKFENDCKDGCFIASCNWWRWKNLGRLMIPNPTWSSRLHLDIRIDYWRHCQQLLIIATTKNSPCHFHRCQPIYSCYIPVIYQSLIIQFIVINHFNQLSGLWQLKSPISITPTVLLYCSPPVITREPPLARLFVSSPNGQNHCFGMSMPWVLTRAMSWTRAIHGPFQGGAVWSYRACCNQMDVDE